MATCNYRTSERLHAAHRGLEFLYEFARDKELFDWHGSDLLTCFCLIAATSSDSKLRRAARNMGAERAKQWRRTNKIIPSDANADIVTEFVQASDASNRLGIADNGFKEYLRKAVGQFTTRDFLYFDPTAEPPPTDVPDACEWCGIWNERERKTCKDCKRRLKMASRYWVWYFALTRTCIGESYGITLGAPYNDVLKWIEEMRPYPKSDGGKNVDFTDAAYAVTHVVYTLNGYNRYKLSPRLLPEEFAFLKRNVAEAVETNNPDLLGELLDSLKAFGLEDSNPDIKDGIDFLLSTQNDDGSWGMPDEEDTYSGYHTTWTAVDALRDYAWQGMAPGVAAKLRRM
jgi:Domain of unknown function (DUF6895)